MGRLSFVGLGLGPRGISLRGVDELRAADLVYLEYYTSPHEPTLLSELRGATGKEMSVVDRAFVEDGARILADAAERKVVLAVLGDPMIATTHSELRARAQRAGIETEVIHAATIAAAASGSSGLHYYRFANPVTITREAVGKLTQAYHVIHRNLLEGSHTLVLLEYDVQSGEGVSPAEAVRGLLKAEENFKRGVFSESTFALVMSRLGREDASQTAGTFRELSALDAGEPPHTLVVPGRLHFTEVESVSAFFRIEPSRVTSNSDAVARTAQTLLPRYVAKTRRALDSVRASLTGQYAPVVENVELYLRDAENFLANKEDELAMLSVGYAEGLLDSLSFSGVVKIAWE